MSLLAPIAAQASDVFNSNSSTLDNKTFSDEVEDIANLKSLVKELQSKIEELDSLGITDASTFEDAFRGEYGGYGERVLTEFTEEFCNDTGILGDLSDIAENCIDYNQVWYYAFQHDFNTVEFRGNTYFFHNCY